PPRRHADHLLGRALGAGPPRGIPRHGCRPPGAFGSVRRADRPRQRARRAGQHHGSGGPFRGRGAARAGRDRGRGLHGVRAARRRRDGGRPHPRARRRGRHRSAAHDDREPDPRAAAHGRGALPHRRAARGLALTPPTEARLATRLSWVAALSFASGLPYFFFNETVPVWLAASGMSLAGIGLASGASLPWALKFLWAPLVDRLGS